MLARRYRLVKKRDFETVYRRGQRAASRFFSVQTLATHRPLTRVAVVVSTKISKRATVRNRLKRQVRATVQRLLPTLPTGWDIVIRVRTLVADRREYPAFQEELRSLLARPFSG